MPAPLGQVQDEWKKKAVILIRHAESEENVSIEESTKAIERLSRGRFPSREQLIGIQNVLFRSHANCALSKRGFEQAYDMQGILEKEQFWEKLGEYFIACSPLKRARQTLEAIHPTLSRNLDRVVILDLLREASAYESAINSSELETRILEFESWLANRPEPTVVIVGHSVYFMQLLSATGVLRNADVVKVNFNPIARGRNKWTEASLLYRTSLSSRHSNYEDMFP